METTAGTAIFLPASARVGDRAAQSSHSARPGGKGSVLFPTFAWADAGNSGALALLRKGKPATPAYLHRGWARVYESTIWSRTGPSPVPNLQLHEALNFDRVGKARLKHELGGGAFLSSPPV